MLIESVIEEKLLEQHYPAKEHLLSCCLNEKFDTRTNEAYPVHISFPGNSFGEPDHHVDVGCQVQQTGNNTGLQQGKMQESERQKLSHRFLQAKHASKRPFSMELGHPVEDGESEPSENLFFPHFKT